MLIVQCVADVAVAIDGNGCDVEDRSDDTKAQNKATQLALHCIQRPTAVEDSQQGQGVRVQRHHQVSHRKAHHKEITWQKIGRKTNIKVGMFHVETFNVVKAFKQ